MLRTLLARWIRPKAQAEEAAGRLIAEGNRAEEAGCLAEACALYRRAVATAPRYARAQLNLGIGLAAAGDGEAARRAYEAALALEPDEPYANYNLAALLLARGEAQRAEPLVRAALARKPDFPEAQVVLAEACDARGDLGAAAAALETALRLRPEYAGALRNYGYALLRLERPLEAEAALAHSIALEPGSVEAHILYATALRAQARIAEALAALGAARRLAPERFELESMELHALTLSDAVSDDELAARHRAFGARLEARHAPRFEPLGNDPDPDRRLRIGYLSSDFNMHPVAWFLQPVLERHDRAGYEITCYATAAKRDAATHALQARADRWRDATALSDEQLADTIHRDAIDILVDLTGHAGVMRLAVFALRPAPVQASWLGYLNTTGLSRMHYRLCDARTDPPGVADAQYSETLLRLPHSQWCYRPQRPAEPAAEPPCAKNGYVTYGSFNDAPKVSTAVCALWAQILARAPDTRMVFVGVPEGHVRERVRAALRGAAVDEARVTFVPRVPLEQYLRWFDAVDVALDTLPYSGGTTTCDTLWMGVPVVTLPGRRSASRSAAAILAVAGLAEWIAAAPEDYVRIALEAARSPARLAGLRRSLRACLRASPLMDEARFVRDLEAAYRRMWRAWCEGRAPSQAELRTSDKQRR